MMPQEGGPQRLTHEQSKFYCRVFTELDQIPLTDQSRRLLNNYFTSSLSKPLVDVIIGRNGKAPDPAFRQRFAGRLFEDSGSLDYQQQIEAQNHGFVHVVLPNPTLNLFKAMYQEHELVEDEDGLNRGLDAVSVPDGLVLRRLARPRLSSRGIWQISVDWTFDGVIDWTASKMVDVLKSGKFDRNRSRLRILRRGLRAIDPSQAGFLVGLDEPVFARNFPPMHATVIMAADERRKGSPSHRLNRTELGMIVDMLLKQD